MEESNYNTILELWDQKYNTNEIAKLTMTQEHEVERLLHQGLELRHASRRIRAKFTNEQID